MAGTDYETSMKNLIPPTGNLSKSNTNKTLLTHNTSEHTLIHRESNLNVPPSNKSMNRDESKQTLQTNITR